MKRFLSLLLAILLAACLLVPVFAAGPKAVPSRQRLPRLVDEAGFLSEKEAGKLLSKLDRESRKLGFDIVILTVEWVDEANITAIADDYFDYSGFGQGPDRDGILLLVSRTPRAYWVSSRGCGEALTTAFGTKYLGEGFLPQLSDNDYYGAFKSFTKRAAQMAKAAKAGRPYSEDNPPPYTGAWTTIGIIDAVIGFIAMGLTANVKRSKLSRVTGKSRADYYVTPESMVLRAQNDQFLRSDTHTEVVGHSSGSGGGSYTSSGGGGTHVSSSGASHGGFGGRY